MTGAADVPEQVNADLSPERAGAPAVPEGRVMRAAYVIGSLGILAATAADALGVAGRHTGLPLLGSIELVQASVVLLAATSMLIVTVTEGHASVHMLTSRLSGATARLFHGMAAHLSALAFLAIAIGSAWVASDLWHGHEMTELLHIPLKWFRLLWIVFSVLVAGAFLRSAWRRFP